MADLQRAQRALARQLAEANRGQIRYLEAVRGGLEEAYGYESWGQIKVIMASLVEMQETLAQAANEYDRLSQV